jgi:hypothetical protein
MYGADFVIHLVWDFNGTGTLGQGAMGNQRQLTYGAVGCIIVAVY